MIRIFPELDLQQGLPENQTQQIKLKICIVLQTSCLRFILNQETYHEPAHKHTYIPVQEIHSYLQPPAVFALHNKPTGDQLINWDH